MIDLFFRVEYKLVFLVEGDKKIINTFCQSLAYTAVGGDMNWIIEKQGWGPVLIGPAAAVEIHESFHAKKAGQRPSLI